jgi:hypothetical protein
LNFAAGDTTKTFSVTVLDDTAVESNETVNLALTNPTNGATLGADAATLTITDNDSTTPPAASFSFSPTAYTVSEGAGTATITVVRTGSTAGAQSVSYATSNGTATSGSDYQSASGTLNFAAGDTSKTFSVTILEDTAVEGSETVSLALSNATGGATIGTGAAVLTITDNDTTTPPAGTPPHLTELVPASAPAGFATSFSMVVKGTGFVSASVVRWNGSAIPTTFDTATRLVATVSPSLVTTQGTAQVTVLNPSASGGASDNSLTFTITTGGSGTPPPFVVKDPWADPNPTFTKTTNLHVLGGTFSAGGESKLTYTWMVIGTPPAPVTFAPGNVARDPVATFSKPGTYRFQVRIRDTVTGFATDTGFLDVAVISKAASLTVTPKTAMLTPGQAFPFRADVVDQFGTLMSRTIVWSASGGSISGSGIFSAPATGRTVKITAKDSADASLTDFADVTIVNGAAGTGTGSILDARAYPVPFKVTSGLPGVTFDRLIPGSEIKIFSTDGRLVRTLQSVNGEDVLWTLDNNSGEKVASWVYFYRMSAGGQKKEGKLVIIK